MTHKLSLIVLGGSGSSIKQIHLSAKQFFLIALAAAAVLSAGAYGFVDYMSLQRKVADKQLVEQQLAEYGQEVVLQRQQIQKFATEINELKSRILNLNQFEERIRILANIDRPDGHDGLFGVGGSAPEDLNPAIELNQKHHKLIKDMHQQMKQLNDASQNQSYAFTHLMGKLEEQKNLLAHTPAIRPAKGWVTSTFAYRKSPFTGKKEFHKGIDIANRSGSEIVATADGVVSFVGTNGAFGNIVVVDHGYGLVTRYAHIQEGLKKKGERVHRGDTIALMGNTGRSTGPHVHYEVRLNGVPVNPSKYILN